MTDIEIKALIYKKGATLSDVAAAGEVSSSTVSRVIKGDIRSRRIAQLISNFLGTPIDKLWPGQYPETYRRRSSEQVMKELRAAAVHLQRHMEAA